MVRRSHVPSMPPPETLTVPCASMLPLGAWRFKHSQVRRSCPFLLVSAVKSVLPWTVSTRRIHGQRAVFVGCPAEVGAGTGALPLAGLGAGNGLAGSGSSAGAAGTGAGAGGSGAGAGGLAGRVTFAPRDRPARGAHTRPRPP